MNRPSRCAVAIPFALSAVLSGGPALAGGFSVGSPSERGFVPRAPVSAFARPAAWFDPARLHVTTSVSVGSGFGRGVNGLQVTTLSYRFQAPLWMDLSIGNAFGADAARGGRSLFLEGFDVGFRPTPNMQFEVHYRDVRSPLQRPRYGDYGTWGR